MISVTLTRLVLSTAFVLVFCIVNSHAAAPHQLAKRIDAVAAKEFSSDRPGGVVLIARGERVLFRREYGLADMELSVPMRADNVFRIGSITKQFTAVAILILVEQGKIALTDDVRVHLPEFPTGEQRITLEQVLTHTSGLPSLVDLKDFDTLARQDHKVDELLSLTKARPLHFAPGTGFRYSDTGYILLGAVIERVTGMSYGDYLKERIFRPLRMNSTFYGDDPRIIKQRAKGYSMRGGIVINAPYISMTVPHAAGGLVSTVDDLLRWDIALRKGSLVGRDLLNRAWQPRMLPDGTHSGYGFGWKMCMFEGHRTIEHGGWINGFGSKAIRFPDDDLNVIVLVNNDSDRPDAGFIARRIAKLLLTGSAELSEHQLTAVQRRALVGRYRLNRGGFLTISERDGNLYNASGSEPGERLVGLSPTTLSFARGDRTFLFSFEMGSDGRAKKVRTTLSCEPGATGERVD